MSEAEWLDCTDPGPMLAFLKGKASERNLRLYAVACCRRIWPLLREKKVTRRTVEFAEKFADGLATKDELHGRAWGPIGEFHGVVLWSGWDAAETSTNHANGIVE